MAKTKFKWGYGPDEEEGEILKCIETQNGNMCLIKLKDRSVKWVKESDLEVPENDE